MTVHLLDINVLSALAGPQHINHTQALAWFAKVGRAEWATCPITQLGFLRISSNPKIIREAVRPREALAVLVKITKVAGHRFWPDVPAPAEAVLFSSTTLVGHRQLTDVYLLTLAQHHQGRLATLDGGVSALIANPRDRARHITVIPREPA